MRCGLGFRDIVIDACCAVSHVMRRTVNSFWEVMECDLIRKDGNLIGFGLYQVLRAWRTCSWIGAGMMMEERRHDGSCTQEPRPSDRVGELRQLRARYLEKLLHHREQSRLDDVEVPHEGPRPSLHSGRGVS